MQKQIPSAKDFAVPLKKQGGGPRQGGGFTQEIARERWERFNEERRERESGKSDWKRVEEATLLSFGRSPVEMMKICREFVMKLENLSDKDEIGMEVLKLYLELSKRQEVEKTD